eukprot:TRINITY_DN5940_c0_g2_i1.p1 TRINITY_DN5940_c0_g2~~TRINITY_DN5940_c0_g2_i1.p1  ORF type:complete len:937 (+),score=234.67 TRINITY_DN5940_c0_g2_i1:46-2856(+)
MRPLFAFAWAWCVVGRRADAVALPSWFGDDMVLQTNSGSGLRSVLNGRAAPGETVTITEEGEGPRGTLAGNYTVTADARGAWEVTLAPGDRVHAHSPLITVTVTGSRGGVAVARHTTRGDVALCSGDDNMLLPLRDAAPGGALPAPPADMRFFVVPWSAAGKGPQFDISHNTSACGSVGAASCGRWVTAGEAAASGLLANFSAVCYLTMRRAVQMRQQGAGPVGMVLAAWAGSSIRSWLPEGAGVSCGLHSVAPPLPPPPPSAASVLYNNMVHPFARMSLSIVLWAQGRADVAVPSAGAAYACALTALVQSWRAAKNIGDFPFIAFQLPAAHASPAPCRPDGVCDVRLAQGSVVPAPHGAVDISGVVAAYDLPGASPHGAAYPRRQGELAKRAGVQIARIAFGTLPPYVDSEAAPPSRLASYTGPQVAGAGYRSAAGAVSVAFAPNSSQGLRWADVTGVNWDGTNASCTLCCAGAPPFEVRQDGAWTRVPNANVAFTPGTPSAPDQGLLLTGVGGATAVRFGYQDYVECAVHNGDGFPLLPFVRELNQTAAAARGAPAAGGRGGRQVAPPSMGYNDWNYAHANIDEAAVMEIAGLMEKHGLRAAGYTYLNLDDAWMISRNATTGAIIPDAVRFPSGMKAVADEVHARGFKFGLYTAAKQFTCQNRPGSYLHEAVDAVTYCDWGVDYLKIDLCRGAGYGTQNASWLLFQKGFQECAARTGRAALTSVSSCGDPDGCGRWVAGAADNWRVANDIQADWGSVVNNALAAAKMKPAAAPGKYNDADMLQVGNPGLSIVEQRAHFSMWCILTSPLLIGTNLVTISNDVLSILLNEEAVAVNQDLGPSGASSAQGDLVRRTDEELVFVKRLAAGGVAALLVNLQDAAAAMTLPFDVAGATGPQEVRDLWAHRSLGVHTASYTAPDVAGHGVAFLTLSEPSDI